MHPWPYPFYFAHRGAGLLAPENTLAAFRIGAEHGFQAFECDIKLSADGVLYLMHDDDLDRTTNMSGPARLHPWGLLSLLDAGGWHGPRFAGEAPASLAAITAFCRAHRYWLNLEIKPCPGLECKTAEALADWVKNHWPRGLSLPLLSSFNMDCLAMVAQKGPEIPRALLWAACQDWRVESENQPQQGGYLPALQGHQGTMGAKEAQQAIQKAIDLGCCALIFEHTLITRALIDDTHRQGLRILAYTVNDAEQAMRIKSWGIDGLITDWMD